MLALLRFHLGPTEMVDYSWLRLMATKGETPRFNSTQLCGRQGGPVLTEQAMNMAADTTAAAV